MRSCSRWVLWVGFVWLTGGCGDRPPIVITTSPGSTDGAVTGGAGGSGDAGGTGGVTDGGSGGPETAADTGPAPDRPVGPCIPTGQETCNDKDDDCNGTVDDVDSKFLQSDPLQCGSCNVVCEAPANAIPKCTMGACQYDCAQGAVDIDKGAANGCECLITGATEICDTRDNECNGIVDDGFDLKNDLNNCGSCGKRCVFAFAEASCTSGVCIMGKCRDNFFDRDKDPTNGCEVACLPSNGGIEVCDGADNDCDGVTDEDVTPPAGFQCRNLGVCANTKPSCSTLLNQAKGWVCNYGTDFEEPESLVKGCDGKDNDCDGKTDEPFGVGNDCTAGSGACASVGKIVCNTVDRTKAICNAVPRTPGIELCNGLDDDCDGKVDELLSSADRTTDDKLVYVPAPTDVTIFMYEASRYDATSSSGGADSSLRPCSIAGKQPWSNVTKEEARDACAKVGTGWRLCTKDEWFNACSKSGVNSYPYGATYDANKCNGYEYVDRVAMPGVTTIASGQAAMCIADVSASAGDEILDMSGNVREWVFTTRSPEAFEMRGGAYNVESFAGDAPGLKCTGSIPAPTSDVRLPAVGFRCCLTGRLP